MVTGTTIASTWANNTLNDVATGLTTCVLKDGSQTITANLPMAGFKFTGLGAGSASGDSLRYEQVNGAVTTAGDLLVGTAAGTLARQGVGSSGGILTPSSGATNKVAWVSSQAIPINLGFATSVGSSALTITLTGADGSTDPSDTNPVLIPFRSVTAATGDVTWLKVNAATSFAISSGSTLGTTNSVAFRLWVVGFNDAGTFRLGVINCLSGKSIYPLSGFGIASSTAEGGSGGADSAQVFYTETAVSSKAYVVLAYLSYESGLGTVGTWSATPTRVQLFVPGVPLPGQTVQIAQNQTSANTTGTTTIPADNSIPQKTEGDQYLSQAITPSSAANILDHEVVIAMSNTAGDNPGVALFQDTASDAIAATGITGAIGANVGSNIKLVHRMIAGTSSSTTFNVRAGYSSAGTTTLNGSTSGTSRYGSAAVSAQRVTELMA